MTSGNENKVFPDLIGYELVPNHGGDALMNGNPRNSPALEVLARRLQELLVLVLKEQQELRAEQGQLVASLESLLEEKEDDGKICWSVSDIATKTNIPAKKIKQAMQNGDLPCIVSHKRGRGYVRVARLEDVRAWIARRLTIQITSVPVKKLPLRRKPPNVVF